MSFIICYVEIELNHYIMIERTERPRDIWSMPGEVFFRQAVPLLNLLQLTAKFHSVFGLSKISEPFIHRLCSLFSAADEFVFHCQCVLPTS
jgi:hypothetical protein